MSFLSFLFASPSDPELLAKLGRIERRLEMICAHLGLEAQPQGEELSDRVRSTLLRGKKIEAIKLYREEHGVGLKEAKDAIDAAERLI